MNGKLRAVLFCLLMTLGLQATPVMAASYTYDELNRLITATTDSGETLNYSYDAAGNLTSVEQGHSAPVARAFTAAQPALVNGDFEGAVGVGGVGEAWSAAFSPGLQARYDVVTTSVYGQVYAVNRIQTMNGTAAKSGSMSLSQEIRVNGNTGFSLQGQFKADSLTNARMEAGVEFLNADGKIIDTAKAVVADPPASGWISFHKAVHSPSQAVSARIVLELVFSESGGNGQVSWDHIRFEPR
ncbi:YD repeat-containing protein [Paenibacillus tianmuensis]|uniref:YD repeat-containing protein n=1 Tax=Paenibacillus tianmuensis TaxID=624147 RepID=A0A1G4TQN9_9BACL|nr:RHS repeat domain-containing protein [Paenibacillus tianmuensis]SCW83706.1 YD repeat-containing protein [Paenibacillus tianmuensis]